MRRRAWPARCVPELVDVPGAPLWTASQGAGVPLVLCHGGPGLSDNLQPVAAIVDDLEALRAHWGHESWVVGGHSWGASLALFAALAHPERTLGVVYLAGTGLRWGWHESAHQLRMARLTEAERAELADPADMERFLRLMWTTDFAERARADAVLDRAPLYAFPRDERVFRAASVSQRAKLEAGIEDAVGRLDVPVLVVHGAEDAGPSRAREVADRAPRGRYVEIAGAGHSPWLERPDVLREALRGFLAELPRVCG